MLIALACPRKEAHDGHRALTCVMWDGDFYIYPPEEFYELIKELDEEENGVVDITILDWVCLSCKSHEQRNSDDRRNNA